MTLLSCRFTDEADQQRALIEMHGLYCLSRPSRCLNSSLLTRRSYCSSVRISPATAKFKPAPGMGGFDMSQMQYPPMMQPQPLPAPHTGQDSSHPLALPSSASAKSVSAPLAGSTAPSNSANSLTSTAVSNSGSASSLSAPSLSSGTSATSSSTLASASSDDALKAQHANANGTGPAVSSSNAVPSLTAPFTQQNADQMMAQRYNLSEESWKHHAQARAILSNLIGPNGEQLTSSDPYNTTVFVGGLSPLISEETLRTFFAPFGEIHYVSSPTRLFAHDVTHRCF